MTAQAISTGDNHLAGLDEQLCFALYTASHRIIRAYRPLLEPLGLTYVQYLVMLVLWENAPRSVGELGASLHLDSGTLTPLLKRLERASLVIRLRDAEDERRVLIHLTEDGKALRERANGIYTDMLCEIEMSRPDALELRKQLIRLADSLA